MIKSFTCLGDAGHPVKRKIRNCCKITCRNVAAPLWLTRRVGWRYLSRRHQSTLNMNLASYQTLPSVSRCTSPEYCRLPKSGTRCPITGLSRSALNELILPCSANGFKPPVRSVVLKKRHAVRGVRLIVVESLLDHLRNLDPIGDTPP